MPDTKLLNSQIEGLLLLEQEANTRISNYLRLCAEDLGLNPEQVAYNRQTRCFVPVEAAAPPASGNGESAVSKAAS
jgi:hypothetical protein